MERTNTVPCRLSSAEDLCRMLKISKYELITAINTGYRPFVNTKTVKLDILKLQIRNLKTFKGH